LEESVSKDKNDNDLQEENEKLEAEVESPSETVEAESEETGQDLEKELAAAQQEAAELRDKMLRMAAESENFKKRIERERSNALKFSGEQIFREILPVVDNLERAIAHCDEVDAADTEANFTGLLQGVQLTLKSLVTTLEKFEVKAINSAGQPFDPNQQEALTMEASESVPASHVVSEFEKGYYYKDRLLRAAKVIVSSGKAEG
jgi:molecular chaperone GrpE